ncbi:MAG TPA: Xaa-Pro peptidase family protein [Xanthobacteraceae bacterium]|jgi:Xaa-Pro dipeptidase|nr:Xaa-Pro peptidase family protein [Xanthobacteraceae bacterium]
MTSAGKISVSAAYRVRVDDLRHAMEAADIDGLLLYGNNWHADYLRYASDFGIVEGQGLALFERDGSVTLLLDDPSEAERARDETAHEVVWAGDLVGAAKSLILRGGNRRVAAAPYQLLPYGLVRHAAELRLSDGGRLIEQLLMDKRAEEHVHVRRAATLADCGYEIFRAAARPGRKDYELIAEIEQFFRSEGVTENFMIIGVGGREVRGMAPPSGKILKEGDLVTTELTPCVEGYYAQICRTLVVGQPSELQLKSFSVFQEALDAGLKAVRAGVTASDVARAENDVFRQYGLGQYVTSEYTRVRGHGIGLFPDQKPHVLEDVAIPLTANMTIIVHPNTYHPDVGYLVLGDTIIVTPDGHETLSAMPRVLLSA